MSAKLTAVACRAARGLLAWTVRDLMREAGVSPNTVTALEAGQSVRAETAAKIVAALEANGVEITNGDGTGARLLGPLWSLSFVKVGAGFTFHPATGQLPALFDTFATPDAARDWAEAQGYRMVGNNVDLWRGPSR